ncbi:hypothetical protein RND71_009973 [Anisodus tanguticus]|uniref:Uncharacterized protein n=1 Tax=Anisodus tanguticus TaxID=243964 RepID=A0AAE1SGD7_9SOLA|nr:hypothetical protein RND71_009973 [Anisodus tanguticus]
MSMALLVLVLVRFTGPVSGEKEAILPQFHDYHTFRGTWKMNIGKLEIGDYLAIGAILFATDSVCTLQAGLLSAYIIKKLYFGRHSTDREVAIMILMAYLSYMVAEFTIWWAGLMRGAVSMALPYNQFTKGGHTQLRGNAIMITSTITVVIFSTVVFGLMTKPLIRLLLPSSKNLIRSISSEPGSPKSFINMPLLIGNGQDSEADDLGRGHNIPRPISLRMLLTTPSHTVHYYCRKFDNAFMRPVFGGRGFVPFVPGSPTEQQSDWH